MIHPGKRAEFTHSDENERRGRAPQCGRARQQRSEIRGAIRERSDRAIIADEQPRVGQIPILGSWIVADPRTHTRRIPISVITILPRSLDLPLFSFPFFHSLSLFCKREHCPADYSRLAVTLEITRAIFSAASCAGSALTLPSSPSACGRPARDAPKKMCGTAAKPRYREP